MDMLHESRQLKHINKKEKNIYVASPQIFLQHTYNNAEYLCPMCVN